MTTVTVVIPAHDEESVIATAISALLDAPDHDLELIVVANGCRDRTAQRASEASERVRVLVVDRASKIAALNAGSDAASQAPVAFVDADVVVSGRDLHALAERLEASDSALVASPAICVLASRSWWVRQYYRVWELTDYRSSGHIGSGVYMLSAEGRARFDRFPEVIADDLFVQRLFDPTERLTPSDLRFTVRAPGTLAALVKRNTRIAAGNLQLASVRPDLASSSNGGGVRSLVRRVARRPGTWLGFVVYVAVYTTARRRARALLRGEKDVAWNRDETTREPVA